MALHIKDARAEAAIRELARLRNVSLTEAAQVAAEEALKRDRRHLPLADRLTGIWARLDAMPDASVKLDKTFYDKLWGEDELRGKLE